MTGNVTSARPDTVQTRKKTQSSCRIESYKKQSWCGIFSGFQAAPKMPIAISLLSTTVIRRGWALWHAYHPGPLRKSKDKPKAENSVLIVEKWLLARIRNGIFHTLRALNARLRELLADMNNRLMRGERGNMLTGPTPYYSRSLSISSIIFSWGGRIPPSQNKRKPGEGYRYCSVFHDFHAPALSDADVQRWWAHHHRSRSPAHVGEPGHAESLGYSQSLG